MWCVKSGTQMSSERGIWKGRQAWQRKHMEIEKWEEKDRAERHKTAFLMEGREMGR